jgi:hypothetical protein
MVEYNLDKPDWDWLLEIASLPVTITQPSAKSVVGGGVPTAAKTALTKAFSSLSKKTCIVKSSGTGTKRSAAELKRATVTADDDEREDPEDDGDEDDDLDGCWGTAPPPNKKKQRV